MKFSVQVIVHPDNDTEASPVVREVFALDRDDLAPDTLGLQLAEAKDLLAAVQDTVVEQQVNAAITKQVACPDCGRARRHKDTRTIVVRSLFGALRLASPRWWHCGCRDQPARTFQPLAGLLPERTTPELAYLQARFAALVSYGITADLLSELLPLGRRLHPAVVRRQTQAVAQRLEDELGEEQPSFIDTCQRDREELPRPDLPIVVGLDGGYVHSSQQRSRTDGWFEVIAGKAIPADGRPACFGYVQTYDTKPKRRLFEVLKAQGMAANQQVTFLTDGGEDIRDLPCYLNAQAEHLLDWFHLTMRITVMAEHGQVLAAATAGPATSRHDRRPTSPARSAAQLQRLKWFCWHGNVFRALQTIDDILFDLDITEPCPRAGPAAQGGRRVRQLHPRQRRADPQLRGTPACWRGHLHRVHRIRGQPGHQQAHGQETADALDTPRRPPPAPGPHPRPQRPARRRLPPLVPRPQPDTGPHDARRVASPTLSRSPVHGA